MQWFKHFNNFRNTPAMRMIAESLGERGVAAAYRLLEVMCEQCGTGDRYTPTLILVAPRNLGWLSRELFIPHPEEPYDGGITNKETQEFLDLFASAGLIDLTEKTVGMLVKNKETGKFAPKDVSYPAITLLGFEENLDEWTMRKRKAIDKAMAKSGKKKLTLTTPR